MTTETHDWDLYAEHNEPAVKHHAVVYHVQIPGHPREVNCRILVYRDGLIELDYFWWFGVKGPKEGGGYRLSNPEDKKIWDTRIEVLEWLHEWELIVLRRIGPEDSEWFATDKLTGENVTPGGSND